MIEVQVNVAVGARTATIAQVREQIGDNFIFDLFDAQGMVAQNRYAVAADCPFVLTQAEIDAAVLAETFVVTAAQFPSLSDAQIDAYRAIDEAAGRTRRKYITDVSGQSETYLIKYDQAAAYKAAGYPSASIASYPMVQSEGRALYGATPSAAQYQAATDYIVATQAQWIALAADIEEQRRAGKEAVAVAITSADVLSIQTTTIAALEAL